MLVRLFRREGQEVGRRERTFLKRMRPQAATTATDEGTITAELISESR